MIKLSNSDLSRFWSKVDKGESCWLWTAAVHSGGYGVIRVGSSPGKLLYAHRVSYEIANGPIPRGKHLDHLCRNPRCCNPKHLEAVDPRTNMLRGMAPAAKAVRRGHCEKGHPYDYLRPDGHGRQCVTCKHEYWKEWYAKNKKRLQEKERARSKSKMLGSVL